MNWTEYLKFQEKTPTGKSTVDPLSNFGLGPGEIGPTHVVIHSKPEYTVIDETEETVFVQDENGAPHVFTREEWQKMQGTGAAGLAVLGAAAAALLLLA